jgi:PAS domain S-box-containing protein
MDKQISIRGTALAVAVLMLVLIFLAVRLSAPEFPLAAAALIALLPAAVAGLCGHYLSREARRLGPWLETMAAARPDLLDRPRPFLSELRAIRNVAEKAMAGQRELQSRLSRIEKILAPIMDQMEEAVLILDINEVIQSLNPAAREIFGYTAEELIGESYTKLLPNGDPKYEGFLQRFQQKGRVLKYQTTRRSAGGQEAAVQISRFMIKDDEGRPAGAVEILKDISEDRRIAQDLLTTEKMAAVGKMSSKVVHEIRNPLASISLNVDLLGDSLRHLPPNEEGEASEILLNLKRETRRLRQITEEYLQFSRLLRKEFRREDVNQVLLELADFARPEFRRKGIQILLRLDEKQPRAMIDAGSIRQAGLNLVRNAMEAADPEGHIRLSTMDLGDTIEIRVADDGCGIAEKDLAHIFDPFYTTKRDGTGLGLAVVRQIVEEHGGRIQVRSLPQRGTTFVIVLPKENAGREGAPPS